MLGGAQLVDAAPGPVARQPAVGAVDGVEQVGVGVLQPQ